MSIPKYRRLYQYIRQLQDKISENENLDIKVIFTLTLLLEISLFHPPEHPKCVQHQFRHLRS